MTARIVLFTLFMSMIPAIASATPRPLPMTYPYATLPDGGLELEAFVDIVPVRVLDTSGAMAIRPRSDLTLEVEYGLTDHLELGLYFVASDMPGAGGGFSFEGIKQRLRYRLADAGEWPVDVSIYGEIAELKEEIELEAKINLEKRFGDLSVQVNLWGEHEFYFSGESEWVLHPTAGVVYAFSPNFSLGLEYWMQAEFGVDAGGDPIEAFNQAPHHFLGPTVMLNFGKLWWALAPYLRLDDLGKPSEVGQELGHVFIRTVLGIEL
ncbi:MAG: hypothetical protein U1E65_01655 [Myxococcota bacterium]